MRILLAAAAAAMLLTATAAQARDVYVRGHTRSDGTYVQPHYRSAPNSSTSDNWSTKGNTNPYTGREGTRDPYPTPQLNTWSAPRQSSQPWTRYQSQQRNSTFGGSSDVLGGGSDLFGE